MTAPWSGSEEADGEEELAEGVGSAEAAEDGELDEGVGSTEGAALGAAAPGDAPRVAGAWALLDVAGTGCTLTFVACWRYRAVAATQPSAGTITRMARNGHTFFHFDGLGRCMPTGMSSPARSNSSLGY